MTTKELIRIARDLGQQQASLDDENLGSRRASILFSREVREWRDSAAQASDSVCVDWADEVMDRARSTHSKVARAYVTAYRRARA